MMFWELSGWGGEMRGWVLLVRGGGEIGIKIRIIKV